jgi:NitT/TauT family transport system permease protein
VSSPETAPAPVAGHSLQVVPERRAGALGRLRDQPLAYRLASLVLVLVVWEALGPYIDPIFFSYPSAIARAFYELTASGELQKYFLQSIQILLYGMLFAIIGGIALGIVMARFARIEWTLDLYVNALYATPMVALVPLLVLWLGIFTEAKVTIVFLFAIFPILINTYQGVKNVDPGLIEVAKSFNTSERRMWVDVLLPSAVPYIAAGIRLAIGRALVGMVIAEFYTAISGLGYMVTRYAHIFQMDKTLVPVILLMAMGVTFSAALKYLEARVAPWNQAHKR